MLPLFALAVLASAVVVQPVTNLFSRPSQDAEVVSQAIYSTNVAVLETQPGWSRVRTPDDYTGWVPSSSLLSSGPYATGSGRVARVESLFAGLYREADITRHQPIVTVPFETRLEVVAGPVGEDARWYQVRLPDDRAAWVQAGDISFRLDRQSIPEMLEFSKRFLGLPYLWGGVSTFGYDCSGFTQMLCRRRGFSLPRDAGPQANWTGMKPVTRDELQPGDLLYFGASPEKITHTGVYLGNGQFINATAYLKPAVQICRLDDEHWTKLLVASRRIQGAPPQ